MQLKNMYGKEGSSHRQRACKRHICAYELCTLYMRVLLHSWAYTVEPGENLTSPCFLGPNSWRDATQTNLKVPGPWEQICCPSFSPLSYFWPSFSRKFFPVLVNQNKHFYALSLSVHFGYFGYTDTRQLFSALLQLRKEAYIVYVFLQIQYCLVLKSCPGLFALHQRYRRSSSREISIQSICQLSRFLSYGDNLRPVWAGASWNQIQMERRTFSWQVKVKLTSFSPTPLWLTFKPVKGWRRNFRVSQKV